ncbi:O-glucosyltransferase rumi homolog isoform X1 [Dendroctonus ponderosae]|uniref:O-glucosyltransferase rumi homolog isoform X1 n=1 Tax=Dendroctonus ponderosae TaxID=77166 RepID=UPI0020361B90|nr:O-glucosyltransferase rumi homolog isoform X1 [Dendroctonus ponderosae]
MPPFSVFKPRLCVILLVIQHAVHVKPSNVSGNNSPDCPSEKVNKYSKEANSKYLKYLNLIADAQRDYKPCNRDRCGCHASVISQDLKMFKEKGISASSIQSVKAKGTKYQVINHKVYREQNCMFPSRCSGIEHFLLEAAPGLPDLELIINTRDWPQIPKNYGFFGPVFSFSKTSEYNDIMYPAWAFWEGGPAISLYPRGIGRWDVHRKELGKLGNSSKWEEKIPKAFFRGSRTCSERDALILLSREKPELADAQYTKNQAWKSEADTLHVAPAQEVSFEEHCQYKYLFNFRGVAASFRLKHILLCKSVVFHVGNEWQEFFYPALKPWIHYIPVDSSASKEQLQELIEFASHHDDVVREIAENGYKMIWNHLRMKDVSCYWRKLLKKYASLQTFKPSRDEMLVEIKG